MFACAHADSELRDYTMTNHFVYTARTSYSDHVRVVTSVLIMPLPVFRHSFCFLPNIY